jgi:glycosyltransferase involved in cell wall biosynthesis
MRSARDLSISCVIPMYNEEQNVAKILRDAQNIFSNLVSDWEIIIVESGSADGTWDKIQETIKGNDRIRAFHQERKEGPGSAFRLGHSKCSKELVCHLEADSPFELDCYKRALPILLENDFVIGFRIGPREMGYRWSYHLMGKRNSFLRMIYHFMYNLIIRLTFDLTVRDVNYSFKIIRREQLRKLSLKSNSWFIDAEMLLELKKNGVLPIEMPIEYRDRTGGISTINLKTPISILKEMLDYRIYRFRR